MPVIMMSGHATVDTAAEASRIGACDFLEKPITLQKLLRAVQSGLSRPHAAAASAPHAAGTSVAHPMAAGAGIVSGERSEGEPIEPGPSSTTPGEAMALGRIALATGWSGNVDFMTRENSLLVEHGMTALNQGDYPHWEGQSWAEPSVEHAVSLARPLLDDASRGAALARRGQVEALRSHGNRAVGLRILARLQEILQHSPRFNPDAPTPAPAAGAGTVESPKARLRRKAKA